MNKVTIDRELLPCPFCGDKPELPSGEGTQYEIECSGCGQAMASVQICDLMSTEERAADSFTNYRYADEFVERAKKKAIENWNIRAAPRQPEGEAISRERVQAEADAFFDWPTADRSSVTTTSCLIFARCIAGMVAAERDATIAERDAEIERLRVKLMTIASAEPGRHNIEWAKAMAATGNNEAYAKWREAFDQRDKLAGLLRDERNWSCVEISCQRGVKDHCLCGTCRILRIDAALVEVKPCQESPAPTT